MVRRVAAFTGQAVIDFDPRRRVSREAFYVFHAANPEVWVLFEEFALQVAAAAGPRRIGARLVWERLRWEGLIRSTRGGAPFKLNDHLVPFYARLFLQRHPEHAALFETRRAAADSEFLS